MHSRHLKWQCKHLAFHDPDNKKNLYMFVLWGLYNFVCFCYLHKFQNMELNFENPIMEKYLYSKFGGEQKSKAVSKVGKLPAGQNEVDGFIVASYYNDAGENDIYSYFPSSSLPISMF